MIISLEELKVIFPNEEEQSLLFKIKSIESVIRSYTKNNFQDRRIRFKAAIVDGKVYGGSPYILKGDTVQISQSINNGVYTVRNASETELILTDEYLFNSPHNVITKVIYPIDVKNIALEMLKWELNYSEKVAAGISSESISRYSVSYNSSGNTVNGYPQSIMQKLKPYMRAKFS